MSDEPSLSVNSMPQLQSKQARADEFENRLIEFAVRIIKFSNSLMKTTAGRHIAGQILRSGTSPAPNYGEARGAESPQDFAHKLRIVLKELNETSIWLRIALKSDLVKPELLNGLISENIELGKIVTAAVKTLRRNALDSKLVRRQKPAPADAQIDPRENSPQMANGNWKMTNGK